ncbi:MAG: hypothetical protein M3416_11110, partial [Acidobacteriota bacterium]|nr:hypothetical protein [Acidobacteriota bacterium]
MRKSLFPNLARACLLALALLAVPAAASAQEPGTRDLLADAHLELTGIDDDLQPGWHLGWAIDGAGDVNG